MKFRALAAGLALAVSLTGCATGGTPEDAAPVANASPSALEGSITVWSWDVAATALKRIAADYEAAHPGTTINVVDVGYDNAYDKISVGLQSGSGLPDLVTVETERVPGYLEQFPTKWVDISAPLESEKANFDPSKIAAASDADGHLFGIPWDSGTDALYVRTDYLSQAKVDPASIVTWADFVAAAEKVKAATGKTAWDLDVSTGSVFLQLMQQQGSGIFDKDGKVAVNSAAGVAALDLLKELNSKGLINNVQGWDARVAAAKSSASAFSPNAVWWAGTLKSEAPELAGKWSVQPLPAFAAGGATTSNNGGSNLMVPAQSKNIDLAVDFAKFALANVDNQNAMMVNEGLFPSYLPALASSVYSDPDPYFGGQAAMKVFAELTGQIPQTFYTGDYAEAVDIVANATQDAILNGTDSQSALDAAADAIATATKREIAG